MEGPAVTERKILLSGLLRKAAVSYEFPRFTVPSKARRYLVPLCIFLLVGCNHEQDAKLAAFRQAASELPQALENLKQAGLSTSWESLDRHVPANENAAATYNQALSILDRSGFTKVPFLKLESLSPTQASDFVTANAKVIAQLKKAAEYKHCDFGNFRTGDVTIPYFVAMRIGARFIALEARYRAEKGDFPGALADVKTLVAIKRHLAESEFTLGLLTEGGLSRLCSETAQRLISATHADPASASALYNEMLREGPGVDIARVLPYEIVTNNQLINEHYVSLSATVPAPATFIPVEDAVRGIPIDMVKAALTARFLQLELKLFHISKDNKLAANLLYEREQQAIYSDANGDITHALNKASYCETDSRVCQSFMRYIALQNVTLTGLNLIAEHKSGTTWPKMLPAAGAVDPFTNQPLRYRSTARGFVVYSVGPDLNDNEGVIDDSFVSISFRYPYDFK
jgi:hypothetical protein